MTAAPGPVTIVTGGTYGIGRRITIELAGRGHRVVAFGLESPQPFSTAENAIPGLKEELAAANLQAILLEADVSNAADVERVVQAALSAYGRVDGLVNNAAVGPLGTSAETSDALWERVLSVNLTGAFLCCRAVIPHMIRQGGGSIVQIGSGASWGRPNMVAYSASKGGLLALAAALAYDHFHDRIRVNTVVPGGGGIESGMTRGRREQSPNAAPRAADGSAAGRPVSGEDVARAVAFLLSDDAATISGTIIDVGCFAFQGGPVPPRPEPATIQGKNA